ncbi:RAMP superfamily CRISPR-associated protein [Spirulina sp. CS-785/01]|uniref:RAMP superfamily CRISPR-associated protein n=1 Tax=Spirulina sp. CS-785/01 TaxID=3021716 RepID=UPI00232C4FE4|nr:RAMP superfamily CRISPR-associated protein [Spirulina sp. CS-785/01]MDB9315007.1 RAMP superfamily CRISPR-associated protein [Spirulina sp. CS-785/01]
MNLPLPTEMPQWYTVNTETQKGWVPQTGDINERHVRDAWDETCPPKAKTGADVTLNNLKVLSPLQVGGGSFPEGGILPAQVAGVPCVPGSSLRGAFLAWLRQNWATFPEEEQGFWGRLVNADYTSWQPRKVRFATIPLKNLRPYPLNPQQEWQIFNDQDSRKKLGVQWQVSPVHPPTVAKSPTARVSQCEPEYKVQVWVRGGLQQQENKWFEQRLKEMLLHQGIGRGTSVGFGRLGRTPPQGKWTVELRGMKPTVQGHGRGKQGEYRWSPQVLRALLRGYFTRLALLVCSKDNALKLTEKVFGGTSGPGGLRLTSFLTEVDPPPQNNSGQETRFANIPKSVTEEVWTITVDCILEYQSLVGKLLALASKLGGMGPGWRRPPHSMRRNKVFRGSEFTISPKSPHKKISDLLEVLLTEVEGLARRFDIPLREHRTAFTGGIVSVWKSKESEKWRDIVHEVCSTNKNNTNRPDWCGCNERVSEYAVRQYNKACYITIFDEQIEQVLRQEGFTQVWSIKGKSV